MRAPLSRSVKRIKRRITRGASRALNVKVSRQLVRHNKKCMCLFKKKKKTDPRALQVFPGRFSGDKKRMNDARTRYSGTFSRYSKVITNCRWNWVSSKWDVV